MGVQSSTTVEPRSGTEISDTAASAKMVLREATPDDARDCGRICFEAFRAIAFAHDFPADFATVEEAVGLMDFAVAQPDIHVVVAECDGRVVGSNVLWEQTPVAGIGPITVDPVIQNGAIGRALMMHVMQRSIERGFIGTRLVQAAYHNRSLALYTKLGFESREPLSVMQGPPVRVSMPGRSVRPATKTDIAACAALHERLHGYSRAGELPSATEQKTARVVERDGRVTGYASSIGFFGHAAGESDEDVIALIGDAPAFAGPGFMVPTCNTTLMRWCLEHGLRIVQPMTLMTTGFYREPRGAWLPSVLF